MRGWIGFGVVMALVGCGEDLPHPEILSFTVDPGEVEAGGTVLAKVELEHFTLTDDDHHHGHEDVAPSIDHDGHDHGDGHGDRNPNEGHIHVYLNTLESNPIAQMVTHELEIQIPDGTDPGDHVLIARLHDSGHFIVEPQVLAEAELRVVE